jgi:hypothetical protein
MPQEHRIAAPPRAGQLAVKPVWTFLAAKAVLYSGRMRSRLAHLLIAILIAAFAIGAPLPAQAGCAQCGDCTTEAPLQDQTSCNDQGLVCNLGQSCSGQAQKMPASADVGPDTDVAGIAFGPAARDALASTVIVPETAPPRL